MRSLRATLSFAISILMVVGPVWAQGKQSQNTDTLRQRMADLERIDIGTKPLAQQVIFKRSLLNVYTQFYSALEQEIRDLATMQSAVSDAALQKDIASQLQALRKEKDLVLSKIGVLKADIQTVATSDLGPSKTLTISKPEIEQALYAYNRVEVNSTPTAPVVAFNKTNAAISSSSIDPSLVSRVNDLNETSRLPGLPPEMTVPGPEPAASPTSNSCYSDAPKVLVDKIARVSQDIRSNNDVTRLSNSIDDLFLYALLDAALPAEDAIQFRGLAAYQYLAETARTDKHLEPSPSSAGGTNLTEKPSVAQILGFFVGRGSLTQDTSDTALTLSTTLNNLLTLGQDYTAANYEKNDFLKRIGVSTSFSLTNQDQVLANAKRSQLQEWSIKARLYGDRDTRSAAFSKFWVENIKPKIQRRLDVITAAHSALNNDASLRALEGNLETDLRAKLIARGLTDQAAIEKELLCGLKVMVYDRVKSGAISPGASAQLALAQAANNLKDAHKNLEEARTLLNEFLDEYMGRPLLSFGYTNHRQVSASDYSEFKLLYEQGMSSLRQLKVNANATVSTYSSPNRMMNQQTLRDISATVSLEGKLDRFYLEDAPDLSKITYSFKGNYRRMFENKGIAGRKADVASAQFRLEIPLFSGMSFPVSVTYASATPTGSKARVRASAGLNFDMDKLIAITSLLRQGK